MESEEKDAKSNDDNRRCCGGLMGQVYVAKRSETELFVRGGHSTKSFITSKITADALWPLDGVCEKRMHLNVVPSEVYPTLQWTSFSYHVEYVLLPTPSSCRMDRGHSEYKQFAIAFAHFVRVSIVTTFTRLDTFHTLMELLSVGYIDDYRYRSTLI